MNTIPEPEKVVKSHLSFFNQRSNNVEINLGRTKNGSKLHETEMTLNIGCHRPGLAQRKNSEYKWEKGILMYFLEQYYKLGLKIATI